MVSRAAINSALLAVIRQGCDGTLVVGPGALVVVRCGPVTLEVCNGHDGSVDGQLLVVDTKTMTMCVRVREETRLENWVGRRLDIRNSMRGRESRLLNLGEVVLNINIQNELADRAEGELAVRPNLGKVENVVAEFLGSVIGCHCLLCPE